MEIYTDADNASWQGARLRTSAPVAAASPATGPFLAAPSADVAWFAGAATFAGAVKPTVMGTHNSTQRPGPPPRDRHPLT